MATVVLCDMPFRTFSSRADHRDGLINPKYSEAIQQNVDAIPTWRRQVVEWLQEVRVFEWLHAEGVAGA